MRALIVNTFFVITAIVVHCQSARCKPLYRTLPIRVAVIDTGIGSNYINHSSLCSSGHKDFTKTDIYDHIGHGTHIFGLIDQYAKGISLSNDDKPSLLEKTKVPYCQIIIKFFDSSLLPRVDSLQAMKFSIRYAIDLKVDIINISAGGTNFDSEEALLIKEALDKNILVILAAGNNSQYLTQSPKNLAEGKYYPAMYDKRAVVVGNGASPSNRSSTSNYGPLVSQWEIGVDRVSLGLHGLSKMTGTSQSTAIFTGKFIRFALSQK